MNPEYWRPELFEISLDQPQDGPNTCKPQGVVCDGLKITVGEKAQIDINRLFGKLGITTSSINLDSLGDTTWCSALDSSSHRCATNKSITLPEQLGVTPDRIVDAINNGNEIVYYPDPQTYYIPETVAPIAVQAPLATPEAISTLSTIAAEQGSNTTAPSQLDNQTTVLNPNMVSKIDPVLVFGLEATAVAGLAFLGYRWFVDRKEKKKVHDRAAKVLVGAKNSSRGIEKRRNEPESGIAFVDSNNPGEIHTEMPKASGWRGQKLRLDQQKRGIIEHNRILEESRHGTPEFYDPANDSLPANLSDFDIPELKDEYKNIDISIAFALENGYLSIVQKLREKKHKIEENIKEVERLTGTDEESKEPKKREKYHEQPLHEGPFPKG